MGKGDVTGAGIGIEGVMGVRREARLGVVVLEAGFWIGAGSSQGITAVLLSS
jgi:hypothetical protein